MINTVRRVLRRLDDWTLEVFNPVLPMPTTADRTARPGRGDLRHGPFVIVPALVVHGRAVVAPRSGPPQSGPAASAAS